MLMSSMPPGNSCEILRAARTASRAIPPAFPLDANIAVNPFLGQTGEDFAHASARLGRVAGIGLTRSRADFAAKIATGAIAYEDLADALAASTSPLAPKDVGALLQHLGQASPPPAKLPSLAELAAKAMMIDWPALIRRSFGLWAAGHFDRGQALWTPRPGQSAFAAWREWAIHDLTPEIAGLTGFCAHVAEAPDSAERAILRAVHTLRISEAAAPSLFHRLLLIDLGGWSQHARWLLWQAELSGGSDTTLTDLLAIRLIWEEALLAHCPQLAPAWEEIVAAYAEPISPTADQVIDAILQEAAERAFQRALQAKLNGPADIAPKPDLHAIFCIDVRSEPFRRALEAQHAGIQTSGFAGFFGLPIAHRPQGTDETQAHLPALLRPALTATSHGDANTEMTTRISARARRAWGRFRQAAVSSFAFVEAAGPLYGAKLICEALGVSPGAAKPQPLPKFEEGMSGEWKAKTAATILQAMSFTRIEARLILLVGHGADMKNNPHQSGYHCGACCGQTGEVSARLLAALLNDPQTRAGLPDHGIMLAPDTLFVAGLHDTVRDEVKLFRDAPAPAHAADLARAEGWLQAAGKVARAQRAPLLPGARADKLTKRGADWAEIRPEWGLAGCAAFIAAPRAMTTGRDLGGRAFLHDYDWKADHDFATLELILTAPVVVASWISLQYYGSSVAPGVFGGGNKLIHNVVGGIGVVEGNGGLLRPGLPWQSLHDGKAIRHDALRLSVMIEAPAEAITAILRKHEALRALVDHRWLHLFALREGRIAGRYQPGSGWEAEIPPAMAA